ncbi:MAG: hypothetical protein Q7J25_12760 [Vicinamibacterales bacterium]|nr:hypothetical protein [Vicinamibacterales bacterium]
MKHDPRSRGGGHNRQHGGESPRQVLARFAPRHDGRRRADLRSAFGNPPQLRRHIVRGLPAIVGVFHQADAHQPFERGRRHRRQRGQRRRVGIDDRGDQARLAAALERLSPGDHLVQERAERKDVGARVGVPRLELLGRHVLKRPQDRAVGRQRLLDRRHHRRARGGPTRRAHLRQTEVEQLRALFRQHDVGRLEVAMDDALAVRAAERVGDLDPAAQGRVERQRAVGEPRGERLAVEQFHDEVIDPALGSDVVDRTDIGVVQR